MVTEIVLMNSTNKKSLWKAIKRRRFLTVSFTLILINCLKDKFVAQKRRIIYSSKQIVENPALNLQEFCNSCATIRFCWSELIFTFLYSKSSIQNGSEQFVWCVYLFYYILRSSWTPRNVIKESYILTFNISISVNI